jgi:hypothetical protein
LVLSFSADEAARACVVRPAGHERQLEFSQGAARLAGQVPRLLGWRPGDFWDATPAELAAILTTFETPAAEPLSRRELDRLLEQDRHG